MNTTELTAVSVVVPAYQEAASIGAAVTRLAEVLDGTGRPYEILVVSDGSSDGTADEARALGLPQVTVLEYFPNQGKGYALRYGFRHATNPLVAFMDGDLDLHPSVLPGFFDRLDADVADVVVGSKVHPDSAVSYPLVRRVASRTFRTLTRLALGLDLGDTQTGIKAMRRSVAAPVMADLQVSGFAFDLEMMCWLVETGARVQEAPVVLDYEFTSRIGAGSMWEALRDLRTVASHSRARRQAAARAARVAAAPAAAPAPAPALALVEPLAPAGAAAPAEQIASVLPLPVPRTRAERSDEMMPRAATR
ncbi:Glycosyltransferase involved in cell wall bisynthesis [Blastococcus fimeti]|nr:Glycosyltransferase involved in cell wall bisynthesis [Blastococcus fimeti]